MYSLCTVCGSHWFLFCLRSDIFSMRSLQVPPFLFCLSLHLFPKCPQFASTSFFSVYDQMYSQCSICGSHWFLFCLSPYLFSGWHIVPQLYIQIKQSRVHSRKALSECKASRRLGKQIRGLSRFLSKPTLQHPHYIYF